MIVAMTRHKWHHPRESTSTLETWTWGLSWGVLFSNHSLLTYYPLKIRHAKKWILHRSTYSIIFDSVKHWDINSCAKFGKSAIREQLDSRYFLIRCDPINVFCNLNHVLDAEIATPCGHSFCGFCVEQFKASGKTACQKCKQPVSAYVKSRFADDIIATVDGECSWCREKLKLDTAKQHVRQCQLVEKPCDLCHKPFKRQDQQQHAQECPLRDIVCACGAQIKKKNEENHVASTCAFKEEPCPLNCGATVKRSVRM